jgi:hypothetical protein
MCCSFLCKVYLKAWNGNTVTFKSFTECYNRDSLMENMLKLITILIDYIFYGLHAKC